MKKCKKSEKCSVIIDVKTKRWKLEENIARVYTGNLLVNRKAKKLALLMIYQRQTM